VIAGEGEGPLARFLADLAAGTPARLYRSDGAFPLERLPAPRFDLVRRPRDYAMFPLLFSRGCPHDCAFCSVTPLYGHRLRRRPVAHVLRDIEAIRRLAPRPYLSFADENLLADRRGGGITEALLPLPPLRVPADLPSARPASSTSLPLGPRPRAVGFDRSTPDPTRSALQAREPRTWARLDAISRPASA
jgi:hypothetical protein